MDWGDLWLLYWFWCSDCGVVVGGMPRRSWGEEGWELPPGREKDASLDVFKLPAKRILF